MDAFTRSVDWQVSLEITDFLYREALALDERRFRDWLGVLSDDITYEVPVRVTREGLAEWELSPTSRIFDDDRETLEVRVRRLETDFAWAEQPPVPIAPRAHRSPSWSVRPRWGLHCKMRRLRCLRGWAPRRILRP